MGGQLATALRTGPRLVLHIIPNISFDETPPFNAKQVQDFIHYFKPAGYERIATRPNIDGWVSFSPPVSTRPDSFPVSFWCSHITKYGQIEVVSVIEERVGDEVVEIKGRELENMIVYTFQSCIDGLRGLGVSGSVSISAVLLDAKSAELHLSRRPSHPIFFDRPKIRLKVINVPIQTNHIGDQLQDMFDDLWLAAGWPKGSPSFDAPQWAGYR